MLHPLLHKVSHRVMPLSVDEHRQLRQAQAPLQEVIRNSWDRAVSAYHFAKSGGVRGGAQIRRADRYRARDFATFDSFVRGYLAVHDVWTSDRRAGTNASERGLPHLLHDRDSQYRRRNLSTTTSIVSDSNSE